MTQQDDPFFDESDLPEEIEELTGQFEHHRFVADPGQGLMRVDKFLSNRMLGTSRNRIQLAAEAECILVNGKPVKSNYRVKPNDEVTVVMDYPRRETKIIAEDIPINVIYEDEELLIVNKPPGLVVHPGHGNYTGTLVNALAFRFQGLPLYGGDDPRPGLVHRIDKNTSGLLLVAKTEHAKLNLAMQFFRKTTQRQYVALVWGNLASESGTIEGNIGRSTKDRQVFTVYPKGDHGKPAVTHYRVLERLGYVNLVECVLETGRTHQIRVHMKEIGHPLFNDEVYGGNKILKGTTFTKYKQFVDNCFEMCPRCALHAQTLGFIHPVTKQPMHFEAPLPDDMQNVIEKWRKYMHRKTEE